MKVGALRDNIYQILKNSSGDLDSIRQTLSNLSDVDLFVWLGEQDNSLRYHLALELDIPLQHLNHTCTTLKQIHHLLG